MPAATAPFGGDLSNVPPELGSGGRAMPGTEVGDDEVLSGRRSLGPSDMEERFERLLLGNCWVR